MPKVSVTEAAKAPVIPTPEDFAGASETRSFFKSDRDPLQLYMNRLDPSAGMRIAPGVGDTVTYVWDGEVTVGDHKLAAGSSLIVEQGACAQVANGDAASLLLTFTSGRPSAGAGSNPHVHLLPVEQVPRYRDLNSPTGVSGAMHANSSSPTCPIWLHENSFPPRAPDAVKSADSLHSHSEDEVIVVVAGQIRLGLRLFGPGTAVAIAANTIYSFTPGPEGLKFINFRAACPTEIRHLSGRVTDEVGYWKERLEAPPRYISFESMAGARA